MTSFAGLPLRYLIGLDSDPGKAGCLTVIGYDATSLPALGIAAGYINCRQEQKGRKPGIIYIDPPDDIEKEYGEPAFSTTSLTFWENLATQLDKWEALGVTCCEIDNLDTYSVEIALQMFDRMRGLDVLVKNANIVGGDKKQLLAHPKAIGVIVEEDCGTPAEYDALRKAAGKPNLPIRFVAYESRAAAQQTAHQIAAGGFFDMGVTFSAEGEYGSSEDILLPTISNASPSMATVTGADIIAFAQSCIGKFTDGPDVVTQAKVIAAAFPDDPVLAAYVKMASNDMPWCGDFVGYVMAHFGMKPPIGPTANDLGFFWVDKWKDFGTPVPVGQEQPGDVVGFIYPGSLHHVTLCAGNGYYIGGNQSDAVTKTKFGATPSFVRRPPLVSAVAGPADPYPLLVNGSVGEAVSRLQALLGVDVDGEFGSDTEAAVRAFQTSHGLEVDGVVGPASWVALGANVPAQTQAVYSGKGSWYSQYKGKSTWVDSGDAPGSAALGVPDEAQGVAFYDRSTLGKWFAVTAPNGITSIELQTDIGPSPSTGRLIDISAAAAERFGYSPSNFPTNGVFKWYAVPVPSSVVGLTPQQQATRFYASRGLAQPPIPPPVVIPVTPPVIPDDRTPIQRSLDDVQTSLDDVQAKLNLLKEQVTVADTPTVDWAKVLQPLIAEVLPKVLPALLPYIIQALPALLPMILNGVTAPKTTGVTPAQVGTAAGVGGIGAVIGGLLTMLFKGMSQ